MPPQPLSGSSLPPFQCDHPGCGVKYRRKEHLNRHAASHSRGDCFSCPYCESTLTRRDAKPCILLALIDRHTNERPVTSCAGISGFITRIERLRRRGHRRLALRVTPGKNAVMVDFPAVHVRNGVSPVLLGREKLQKSRLSTTTFRSRNNPIRLGGSLLTTSIFILIISIQNGHFCTEGHLT